MIRRAYTKATKVHHDPRAAQTGTLYAIWKLPGILRVEDRAMIIPIRIAAVHPFV